MFFLTPFDSRRYIFPRGGPGPKLAYNKACNVYIFSTFLFPIDLEILTYIFSPPAPLQGRSPCQAMIETHRVVNVTNQPTNRYHCVLGDRVKARGTYREYARLPSNHLLCAFLL